MSEQSTKPGFDKGAKRNLFIIGGFFLAAGLISIFFLNGKEGDNAAAASASYLPTEPVGAEENTGGVAANYAELARADQLAAASAAKASGASFLPSAPVKISEDASSAVSAATSTPRQVQLPGAPQSEVPGENSGFENTPDQASRVPVSNSDSLPPDPQAQARADEERQRQQRIADMTFQQKMQSYTGLVQSWGYQTSVVGTESQRPAKVVATAPTAAPAQTAAEPVILYQAGESAFASIDMSINTDEPSTVFATILSGKGKKGVLIGAARRNANNTVTVEFDQIALPKKKTVPCRAVVVNPETGRASLSGDVDYKITQRFILPVIAAGAGKYGELIARQGTTTMGTGVTTTSTSLTSSQIRNAMIGAGVQTGVNTLNKNAEDIDPSVTLQNDLGVEVKFVQDLIIQ